MNDLQQLLSKELGDLYNAEQQIVAALPKMVEAAKSRELKRAFEDHLKLTQNHVRRLDQVFEMLGEKPHGKKCKGMEGLIKEADDAAKEPAAPMVTDAALIGAAQRVEHYEMAGYGCARTYARVLGEMDAAKLLQQTLDEEGEADQLLTRLAEYGVNLTAANGAGTNGRAANGRGAAQRTTGGTARSRASALSDGGASGRGSSARSSAGGSTTRTKASSTAKSGAKSTSKAGASRSGTSKGSTKKK
jgi:ferritin-like metal-binding protein YciE